MSIYTPIMDSVRNEQKAIGLTAVNVSESRNDVKPRITILCRNTSPNATDNITINLGFSIPTANNGIVLRQYESYKERLKS